MGRLTPLDRDKHMTSYAPRDYMARMWMHRDDIGYDPEVKAWRYSIRTAIRSYEDETQEDLDDYVERLPLVVPGLKVVKALLHKHHARDVARGYIWFTWTRKAMWARMREIFDEFRVADERLAYMVCRGVIEPRNGQLRLPGVVRQEGVVTSRGIVTAAWTPWGLQRMDGGFCRRISSPDRGGLAAIPYGDRQCVVGNEWWYVGSRGDSEAIMTLEIQASPLDGRTQENLLDNLKTFRAQPTRYERLADDPV